MKRIIDIKKLVEPLQNSITHIEQLYALLDLDPVDEFACGEDPEMILETFHDSVTCSKVYTNGFVILEICSDGEISLTVPDRYSNNVNQWPLYQYLIQHRLINVFG